jgi:hypothetical protein
MRRAVGARWRVGAVFAAAALLLATRAAAEVVVEPIARLAVEGGYDSNVRYDGGGGDQVAGVSPDVGIRMRDHLWELTAAYGADVLKYQTEVDGAVINQRGVFELQSRFSPRTRLDVKFRGTYAPDPVGLARLGIIARNGSAIVLRGDGRLAWRWTERATLAATYAERGAVLSEEGGSLLHAPGVEAAYRLDPRTELATAYRFDVFQSLTEGLPSSTAHELKGIARWRWSRRSMLTAEGGPALWNGPGGPSLVPEASFAYLYSGREGDVRVEARHGLGLSSLARPSLSDSFEVGAALRLGRSFRLRADAGLWRGGQLPTGDETNVGYGVGAELSWLATRGVEMGILATRFARIDEPSAASERNVVGLRLAWQHQNR